MQRIIRYFNILFDYVSILILLLWPFIVLVILSVLVISMFVLSLILSSVDKYNHVDQRSYHRKQ